MGTLLRNPAISRMKFLVFAGLVVVVAGMSLEKQGGHLTGQALADYVNTKQSLFKAKDSRMTLDEMRSKIMAPAYRPTHHPLPFTDGDEWVADADVPTSFDARQKWPSCGSISHIRDQSDCGSCWAVASSEVISDRICIFSNGEQQPYISAGDILSCCTACGDGCDGGYPDKALQWYVSNGAVTGGDYNSHVGCKPYPISPCGGDDAPACPRHSPSAPSCSASCESGYSTPYKADKHFGKSTYAVPWGNPLAIQKELLANGPVATIFDVYEDLYQYTSGIYQHTAGAYIGGHVVKYVGWGEDNGTPYWLIANSWNTTFGEDGYFRIIRGVNEVNIETWVYAAIPKI